MGFSVKVNEDYLTAKLSMHLSHLKPECVKQISEILMSANSTVTDVIFKSLDGYVFSDSLYVPGDTVLVHTDALYTYRYDEEAMRNEGMIDSSSHMVATVKSVDKYAEGMRVTYPAINSSGDKITAEWSIEMNQVIKTIGLTRPNLDELI